MPDKKKTEKPGVFFADESDVSELTGQSNYASSEKIAREELARLKPEKQAKRCGAEIIKAGRTKTIVAVEFFGRTFEVTFPSGEVIDPNGGEIPVWERILILHYLTGDSPAPAFKELIGFAQVPSGGFYFEAYKKRSHDPLARVFGSQPGLLIEAGALLGARPEELGDVGVRLQVFPKVPVVAVVYGADDEFPADAKVFFESTINAYFCTEDIAVIGGLVAGRLIAAAKKIQGD
ncbi:MAG: DUF3786 domain-containing protein [Deltaproteobacteria bacterium]|nr:DUF3786 domain-containing protein [Deltaproteobacteria bacterium]